MGKLSGNYTGNEKQKTSQCLLWLTLFLNLFTDLDECDLVRKPYVQKS